MSKKSNRMPLAVLMISSLLVPCSLNAQDAAEPTLETATTIQCTFSLMAVGTWGDEEPEAEVTPADLELQFESVNADEATAQLASGFGTYDIIVRYSRGYLHFMQSFLDGPLYVTTVLEKETSGGRLKAMHSRHEFTDFALTGFTSSPEQYYGDCEILN
jgi:hypothetical protein